MPRLAVWGCAFFAAACGPAPALPSMEPGEVGRVTKIIDGDALVLNTGQSVRLVSIEAPALHPRDRPPEPYAADSARLLEDLALGRRVQLFYPGLTRDRHGRALAHVVTIDGSGDPVWLNREMLQRGAARVRLYPDTAARGDELLQIEREARRTRIGLWARAEYQVAAAAEIGSADRGFRLIRAHLAETVPSAADPYRTPACTRRLQRAALRVTVQNAARTACSLPDGTAVLMRGYVSDLALDLSYSRHLEPLSDD